MQINVRRNYGITSKIEKEYWYGILRRNCLLRQVIEGKIEIIGRLGRRCRMNLRKEEDKII
jgi:hypothetical protein